MIELEFAKSAKFTARENFALYGTSSVTNNSDEVYSYMYLVFYSISV